LFATIAGMAPVVVAITETLKMAFLPVKFAPLASLLLGVGLAFVFPAASAALTVFKGVVIGLTASGLYSGSKTTIAGFKQPAT